MAALKDSQLPPPHKAKAAFRQAMDSWDEESADRAIASLARTAGANELFELFCRYGARDYRSIGHKAIYVANSWRTLQSIGWQHAEPVLRSLTSALLNHGDEPNPAQNSFAADHPWRRNLELESSIRDDWQDGALTSDATSELVDALHSGSPDSASDLAVELVNAGVAPRSIWDAVFVSSGELLMRRPGIIGLHAMTTANALHYAYQSSRSNATRRVLLLQNCSFLPLFRQSALDQGKVSDARIADLEPAKLENASPVAAVEEIFEDVSNQRHLAAAKVRTFLQSGGDATQVLNAARRLVFLKGRDAHDYKFSSAALEDYHHVSPEWRDLFLALSVFNLRGAGEPDSNLVARTRNSLRV
jgi:hypothetical protein